MNHKPQLIHWLQAELGHLTGRRYQIDLEALDVQSLREFHRLLRDYHPTETVSAALVKLLKAMDLHGIVVVMLR